MKLDMGGVIWAATVTISNGVKTVTNVTANGIPTATFDPADFLTPEEVFSWVSAAEVHGVKLAHVTYDEQWGFPAVVVGITDTSIPITDYRISEFTELVAANGSPDTIAGANRRPASQFQSHGLPATRGRSGESRALRRRGRLSLRFGAGPDGALPHSGGVTRRGPGLHRFGPHLPKHLE